MAEEGTETSENTSYTVRFADGGDPVTFSNIKKPEDSVWVTKDPRKVEFVSESFILDSKPKIGEILEKNGWHYRVTEPRHEGLRERWGKDSVFVTRITEEEFRRLSAASIAADLR